jgi:hypothetical protein
MKRNIYLSLVKDATYWKTEALIGVLCRLILSSTMYGIWRAKNAIKHSIINHRVSIITNLEFSSLPHI